MKKITFALGLIIFLIITVGMVEIPKDDTSILETTSWCCMDKSHNTAGGSACENTKKYFDTYAECRNYNNDYKEKNPDHYCGCN